MVKSCSCLLTTVYTFSSLKGEYMKMSDKELLYQALKEKNYFKFGKKDSLQVLSTAKSLEEIVIKVERSCNTDRLLFRYDQKDKSFYRIALNQEDFDLLDLETRYTTLPQCRIKKCLSRVINFSDFINLLKNQFEAIAIYTYEEIKN